MRKIKSVFFGIMCAFGMLVAQMSYALACTADEIDIGDGLCEDAKFTVTTTNLSSNKTFKFVLSATGTFYVDWGDNTPVTTITRVDTAPTEYSHTFATGGVKYIRFGGVATGYNTTTYADKDASGAAIRFGAATNQTSTQTGGSALLVAGLSGSIGAVFPTLGNANNQSPIFFEMCVGCSNLTYVDGSLFTGVTTAKKNMYRSVFDKCSKLTTVPGNLFSGTIGSAESMYRSAFYECTSLSSIPGTLFSGISGAQKSMFMYTFYGTTGLAGQYIPPALFTGLNGGTATDLFKSTFTGSGLVTTCPDGTDEYAAYNKYKTAWENRVACEVIQVAECPDATYMQDGVCLPCPSGYDYNKTSGKTAVTQCTMYCNAGTWTGEYEQLEYLEASGTQYIDTGHVIASTTFSADMEISSGVNVSTTIGHFGGNQDALNGHAFNFKDGTYGLWVAFAKNNSTGTKTKHGGPFSANAVQTLHYGFNGNQRTITVNGDSKTESFNGSIISDNTYRLFSNGCVGGCNDIMLTGRIHWYKVYEGGNLIFDFIPVRRTSDNVLGMYDRVSGQLFTNDGTGNFIAGPVVATIAGNACENVGYGYYSSASEIHYGDVGTRGQCAQGEITDTETSTSVSDCRSASNEVVCAAGTYLAANDTSCTACPAGSWCPGGVLEMDTVDVGINSCATEIGSGWTSAANSDEQTDCYYLVALNKNGFSGTIEANVGVGCHVVSTADGTRNAQLKLFYNTRCTLPAIVLTQTGYANSTGWSANNTVGATQVTNIAPLTATPTVATYYARKGNCAVNYYKTGDTTCGACPAHSSNARENVFEYCTCADGFTADGSSNGATTSTAACRAIGNMSCAAGKYVPAGTDRCDICPVGSYCAGGNFTVDENDQGIKNCAAEINQIGWTSVAGQSAKTDCYYPITLNKNGFSGDILENAGTGCRVLSDATGTNDAILRLFYNTACTLPTIDLTQTGYSNATEWTNVNTLGSDPTVYSTIAATTSAPAITTYYAHKASCAADFYKSGSTQCSACGPNSSTPAHNLVSTCNCFSGFTVDGTSQGATTGTSGCTYIVEGSTYLHAGNKMYKVLSQRRTTPSICIGMENNTYYVSLVPTEIADALAVEYNNMTYSGCDIVNDYCITDGVLYWADPNLYLKSNGTQYINTGVVPDLNTAIEIEMADTSSNTYGLFGVKTGTLATSDEGFGISLSGGNFGFFRTDTSISAIPKDNNYHVYYLSNTEAKIDGVSYNFGSASTPIGGNWPMYMFGFNHKGAAIDKTLNIKYLKIWSGNTLVRHFVPVPSGLTIGSYTTTENGMFDIVTQTFYANDGGIGNFQYGKAQ